MGGTELKWSRNWHTRPINHPPFALKRMKGFVRFNDSTDAKRSADVFPGGACSEPADVYNLVTSQAP